MGSLFRRAYPGAPLAPGPTYWFPFRRSRLIVLQAITGTTLLQATSEELTALQPHEIVHVGHIDGVACLACEIDHEALLSEGQAELELRGLFGLLDETAYGAAGYASQILHWQRVSRFCPVCGSPNGPLGESWGRVCPQCSHTGYPPVIPSVLAVVHRDEHILLGHRASWGPRYSIFAGFVEPGETLEEAVAREVSEEAGVEIDHITYFGSQPWPFPSQMMVGYLASYKSGEPTPDHDEMDEVKWFHIDALPNLPPPLSLSYQLVQHWMRSLRPE